MKKWSTSSTMSSSSVSLSQVLEARKGPLNEVETWSLASMTAHALQDLLLSINGRRTTTCSSTTSLHRYRSLVVTPATLRCTSSGKVALAAAAAEDEDRREYEHPRLRARSDLNERELEAVGIYSLGRTLREGLRGSQDSALSEALSGMISGMLHPDPARSVTLLGLLGTVTDHWQILVGASPISRFVSQLCKVTLGWNTSRISSSSMRSTRSSSMSSSIHSSCSSIAMTNHDSRSNVITDRCLGGQQQIQLPLPPKAKEEEIEFSRLDSSSSSESGSSSPVLPSSFESSNNNNDKPTPLVRGPFGRRLDYQPTIRASEEDEEEEGRGVYENIRFSSTLERARSDQPKTGQQQQQQHNHNPSTQTPVSVTKPRSKVQRNPSRLYRVVKPLTNITPTPSPATKRCVGPEFIVMASESRHTVIDLASHLRKDSAQPKQVNVICLDGQRIVFNVSPNSITSGELLDHVLSQQDLKESYYYSLAAREQGEYLVMSNDTKVYKAAPLGWRDARSHAPPVQSFDVYLRFKYYPASVDNFKDPNNKHQLYLQLRRDLIEGGYHMSNDKYLSLAAMSLQTEFGDFSEDIHGDGEYFVAEHYLPYHAIRQIGEREAKVALTRLHRAHQGQSQSKTELRYCKEIQRLDNYGFHAFSVRETKKPTSLPKRHLGIHMQGVFLFETSKDMSRQHKILASFYWHGITRIQYDKSRFQLSVSESGGGDASKTSKIKFYVSEAKAKLMFDLASAHHQFYIQQRLNKEKQEEEKSSRLDDTESAFVEYREPRDLVNIRSLKNKLLAKKQLSAKKLYTNSQQRTTRRSLNGGPSSELMVQRLTHYSSMADALSKGKKEEERERASAAAELNASNKENETPNNARRSYRYKVYLEPEEDINPESTDPSDARLPLQEKPIHSDTPPVPPRPPRPSAASTTTTTTRRRIATLPSTPLNAHRRRSESLARPMKTSAAATPLPRKSGRRSAGGIIGGTNLKMRMGTRTSISALHRERIRTTPLVPSLTSKKKTLDLDYDTMEFKSLMPKPPHSSSSAFVVQTSVKSLEHVVVPYDDTEESISDSLIERFDNMESEDSEPERQIVSVSVLKDNQGRLGLKITGTPSGIYIDQVNRTAVVDGSLKLGDRIVAINGRSLENVPYAGALELIKKSQQSVQFLVSQIKTA